MKTISIKRSREDIIFDTMNYFLLSLALIVVLYPLYFIIIASISNPVAVQSGKVIFVPVQVTFEGYKKIFEYKDIWIGYRNTLMYTFLGTLINIFLTMLMAYPLSRKKFSGKRVVMIFLIITMYFNGGLIPTYLVVKNLGLLNNWMVMVVVGAINVFNVIITRSFMENTIPEELYEAATIDGSSHFQYFFKVVLPLSKAIMAVLALYYGVAHWNDYFKGLIYLKDNNLYPLQLILRGILVQNDVSDTMMDMEDAERRQALVELMKYGLIIVSSIPVLIIYPFMQKYFIKGVMIGSVKG
ncbi:carbohydrate ABC transporter permease [Vallitalea okinawensis]|uniref:carbohydrate ABC transporter permease n=1 Tax=Vallitalea okinawensis TaxID=2078660 RepID=UPI000CFC7B79|nr:carbohydrate ABC transporter permease [Vallitalea okinawensis]